MMGLVAGILVLLAMSTAVVLGSLVLYDPDRSHR